MNNSERNSNLGVWLNDATRWSKLARFGSSNLARLTIVTPFLGFLIFLNVNLEGYIELGPSELGEGWLKYFSDRRVVLLYLGLTVLGSAVGVFSILAPDAVASSRKYSDYIAFKEETKTSNAVEGSLEKILDFCMSYMGTEYNPSFFDIRPNRDFPEKIQDSILRLVNEVYAQSDEIYIRGFESGSLKDQEVSENSEDDRPQYLMYNGMPDTDIILESIASRRRVEFPMWKGFFLTANKFSIDVFRLEYLIADYSRPNLRLLVFSLIALGTIVTIVPTVISIFLVLFLSF